MLFLKIINYINFKWNNLIGYIHDVSAKMGIGNWTVWFYDTFIWHLSNKWRIIGNVRYNEYLLQHEISRQEHQIQYFANLAADLSWELIDMRCSEDNTDILNQKMKINKNTR